MRKALSLWSDQDGQAVVEYILTLSLVILLVSGIAIAFRKSLFAFWTIITRDVTAACPGCPANPSYRIR